ncbi:PepSY domain-containing protein [Dysgonomonas sp. Marseille-P4677]|nr:PepSY-associated TM helix domain-containing protein [Dysgonomonas sp. Marseille-P4677]MBK5720647.1 PepSY domain-containing protein [Dysgonomonas sp. Marseille-P4677]
MLGTILSILFLLWFLTGFVMIYHNFPKINNIEKYRGLAQIDTILGNDMDSLIADLSSSGQRIESFLLKSSTKGGFQIEYKTEDNYFIVDGLGQFTNRQSFSNIQSYASKVNSFPVLKVDTLKKLDRWVPYDKHYADFPLYKFYFQDEDESELYVSSKTGEGIQYTNSDSRFWAWVGAIPHWLYIADLRHYTGLWKVIVIGLSGISSLVCVTGIIIAFRSFYKRYKRKKELKSPYKSIYKWHHILGFVFGAVIFTFAFSGMMSLQKVPQWIIKTHNPELVTNANQNPLVIPPDKYPLDYKDVLVAYNGKIQKLEWCMFGNIPYYKAVVNDSLFYLDATSSDDIKELYLSENDIRNKISKIHPDRVINIELMNDYDNYYIHKRHTYSLPVYKIIVDDSDESLYYIDPKTTETRYLNINMKVRKWTYQALHSFSVKYFLDRPILWNILMWVSMIGGTIVSITGVYLGFKFLKREIKRYKQYWNFLL